MGNSASHPHAVPVPAIALQRELEAGREHKDATANPSAIPRSEKRNGRFILSPTVFGEAAANTTKKSFWEWRKTKEDVVTPDMALLERELPVLTPDREALCNPPSGKMAVTWLGHACTLTQFDGWNVLADPIFSHRCSPVSFAGPARVRPSPIQVDGLPDIDVVMISHNHYDHLDKATVVRLNERKQNQSRPLLFAVPLGMAGWMKSVGVENVVEFDWSDEIVLRCQVPATVSAASVVGEDGKDGKKGEDESLKRHPQQQTIKQRPPLTISCMPCQHWCKRTLTDLNKCLWCAWRCGTANGSFFFGGDTGYCGSVWEAIRQRYGGVDVAALPIGAYGAPKERWFHEFTHMCPEEAVQVMPLVAADS